VAANFPATQSTQEFDEIAPGATVLIPVAHDRQNDASARVEYVPFMHKVHEEASFAPEYAPSGQAVQTEADSSEYVPSAQLEQLLDAEAPVVLEYLPAEHAVQKDEFDIPLFEEYVPTVQAVHPVAFTDEYVPGSHCSQAETPYPVAYWPPMQLRHDEELEARCCLEYVPGIHSWQVDAVKAEE